MRYLKIFAITSLHVFEYRGRMLIWFLMSLLNPMLLLLFWGGLTHGSKALLPGWNISIITSYYLLLTILDSVLLCHIEEDIAREDVQKGNLASYVLKPISYYWKKFTEEIPYRIMQGIFALLFIIVVLFFVKQITFDTSPIMLLIAGISSILGLFVSFTLKMILGLFSLWLIEIRGLYEFYDIINFAFGGYIVPLFLLPSLIAKISYFLPFSYVVYVPLSIFQGRLTFSEIIPLFLGQITWLILLVGLYSYVWKKGLKKFTGVGQ